MVGDNFTLLSFYAYEFFHSATLCCGKLGLQLSLVCAVVLLSPFWWWALPEFDSDTMADEVLMSLEFALASHDRNPQSFYAACRALDNLVSSSYVVRYFGCVILCFRSIKEMVP